MTDVRPPKPREAWSARVLTPLAELIVGQTWLAPALVLSMTLVAGVGQFRPELAWQLTERAAESWREFRGPVRADALPPGMRDPGGSEAGGSDAGESEAGESGAVATGRWDSAGGPGADERPPEVDPIRVAAADAIVVARSPDFFTPAGAATVRRVVESLESLDHVRDVFWLGRVPNLNLFGLPEPIFPESGASDSRFRAALDRASAHPLVAGQLMSADGRTLLLMVRFDWLFVERDEDCTVRLRQVASEAASGHPGVPPDFAVTGEVPLRLARAASNRENEIRYQIIGNATALLIAGVLFRGWAAVLVVALAPAAGVFWTIGITRLLGLADNGFSAVILPLLVCMIGFTDGVHMMVHIRRRRAAGQTSVEAAKAAIREVGLACWLTSVTTAIGFAALMLARQQVVREFGLCCVIGVALTFVSVIVIIPWVSATRLGAHLHAGQDRNRIDRGLTRVSGLIAWVLARSGRMAASAIAITAVLAGLASRLEPDQRLTSSLDPSLEAVSALRYLDAALGGLETGRVLVRWTPDVSSRSGEVAEVLEAVERALRDEPLIGHPLSLVGLLAALPGEGPPAGRMSLAELLPPELKRAYYTPESRRAEVQFRVQDLGIASYGPVFERLEQRLTAIGRSHPAFDLSLEGAAVRRWRLLYQVVVDLARSLGTATLIIFGVLTLLFRSLRLGLISVIPNLFPLAATGTLLWVTGGHLEIVSVCAFTVCLGIAVDDTIHFMTRFTEERRSGKPRRQAISDAFVGVGTALIMTTVILSIGFGTALLSEARDHRIFAMMGILTIVTALLGDLFFLPALLDRFSPGEPSEVQAVSETAGQRP